MSQLEKKVSVTIELQRDSSILQFTFVFHTIITKEDVLQALIKKSLRNT